MKGFKEGVDRKVIAESSLVITTDEGSFWPSFEPSVLLYQK